MAGYSGTPLAKKLGIKEGATVALVDAPGDFAQTLGELPASVTLTSGVGGRPAMVVFFTTERSALAARFPALKEAIPPDGAVWIAWPKRSSGVPTDLTEDVLREVCLPAGMVDTKVCAIDDTWSGLRFVWRKELRKARE